MPPDKSYHHGALHEALLAAAETILRRDGLPALTLRAIAREAGVSHGAPAHHFSDLSGLLSELAAAGFERLAAAMQDADRGHLAEVARRYVAFAQSNPALFELMFQVEKLDGKNERLRAARSNAFAIITEASTGGSGHIEPPQLGAITAQWCLVYGFASLAAKGRIVSLLRLGPEGMQLPELLDLALAHLAR